MDVPSIVLSLKGRSTFRACPHSVLVQVRCHSATSSRLTNLLYCLHLSACKSSWGSFQKSLQNQAHQSLEEMHRISKIPIWERKAVVCVCQSQIDAAFAVYDTVRAACGPWPSWHHKMWWFLILMPFFPPRLRPYQVFGSEFLIWELMPRILLHRALWEESLHELIVKLHH